MEQLRFARTALVEVLQNGLRKQAIDSIKTSSARIFDKAIHLTKRYYQQIKREQRNTEEAIAITEKLLSGENQELGNAMLTRKETADLLQVSIDAFKKLGNEWFIGGETKGKWVSRLFRRGYQEAENYTFFALRKLFSYRHLADAECVIQ